ncbi:MAG: hypothetical protein QM679_02125 [Patulibacter sp.]
MNTPELRVQQAITVCMRLTHEVAALQARVLMPGDDQHPPTLVSLEPHGPLLIERAEGTVEVPHHELPHRSEPNVAMPHTPELGPYPPFELGPDGEITGMIGALDGLAAALQRMADAIGGGAVLACDLATTDPQRPLGVAARSGEPVVVLVDDNAYELPA